MNDPRETLNRIRAQAAAATEGPWELLGGGEYVSGPDILVAPDDGGVTSADAEFIAAARTTVPALLDALEKVLELHPREGVMSIDPEHGLIEDGAVCAVCIVNYDHPTWPCPTVEAIITALDGIR